MIESTIDLFRCFACVGNYLFLFMFQNDVEVILDFASSGWVSMGWRPEGLDPSCRLFPDLEHGAPVPVFKRYLSESSTRVSKTQFYREKRKSDAPPKYIEQEGPRPEMPRDNGFRKFAIFLLGKYSLQSQAPFVLLCMLWTAWT